MILTHQRDNHLYLVFQDFEDKVENIYKAIKVFPTKASIEIKEILKENFFSDILQRQSNYVNNISTYIDDISDEGKQYFFHLYILPKDIKLDYEDMNNDELITKIESLSLKLFQLYSQVDKGHRSVELFKQSRGNNFLQLEANFYINKLDKLYSYLLNYKAHSTNKVICSDKSIGVEIDELNRLEGNLLKNYQFIKVAYQKELIKFIYSTISFLKKYRIEIFKSTAPNEYKILGKLSNKINNLLLKISSHKSMIDEKISKETLSKYLVQYKNKKEIKENSKIYETIKSIFYTQLNNDVQFFMSINLAKIFEKIVERKLDGYRDNLFIGDENQKKIIDLNGKSITSLNAINYLLKSNPKIKQYPDFLIKNKIEEQEIYHIIDAKYKLLENKRYDGNDIRQVLSYAILFNKAYSQKLENQKKIKKFIVYPKKSNISLDDIDSIDLNLEEIDIMKKDENYLIFEENLFNSEIVFIGIRIFRSKGSKGSGDANALQQTPK